MAGGTISVDGETRSLHFDDPCESLAWWLRDCGAVSVKIGCEEGTCGACTVLLDDRAVPSCLVPIGRLVDGASVQTAAGVLDEPSGRHALATLEHAPIQCGFCAPGQLVSLTAWIRQHGSAPTADAAVGRLLATHLCRCAGSAGLAATLRIAPQPSLTNGHRSAAP
jgi:aerobic-type carbon monoxide dehydrogenase small subunit (CoxS/CutS family)